MADINGTIMLIDALDLLVQIPLWPILTLAYFCYVVLYRHVQIPLWPILTRYLMLPKFAENNSSDSSMADINKLKLKEFILVIVVQIPLWPILTTDPLAWLGGFLGSDSSMADINLIN